MRIFFCQQKPLLIFSRLKFPTSCFTWWCVHIYYVCALGCCLYTNVLCFGISESKYIYSLNPDLVCCVFCGAPKTHQIFHLVVFNLKMIAIFQNGSLYNSFWKIVKLRSQNYIIIIVLMSTSDIFNFPLVGLMYHFTKIKWNSFISAK